MLYSKLVSQTLALVLVLTLFSAPLLAQRRSAPAKKPAPAQPLEPVVTFDSLLTDDSYIIYSEIRNLGQLVRSSGLNELLDPLIKVAEPPQELRTILKWLNSHAEALATSRMFVATWAVRPGVPSNLIAVEFSTPDEAKKFEADLKSFIPKLKPKPSPTPSPTPAASPLPASSLAVVDVHGQNDSAGNEIQFATKQTGSLVLLTEKPFNLKALKPPRSKLLFEDPNFALARNRFASEPIFIYVDVKGIEKEQQEQRKKWEKESEENLLEQAQAAASPATDRKNEALQPTVEASPEVAPEGEVSATPLPDGILSSDPGVADDNFKLSGEEKSSAGIDMAMMSMWSLLFGGQPKWPEAVGIAVAFEEDSYALRALIVNGPETKSNPIPFMTQLASGPNIVPSAPSVMPADVDIFLSLSLDYPQMYAAMVKSAGDVQEMQRRGFSQPAAPTEPESPFAQYEKKIGLTLKEDILPLLGNELAVAFLSKPAPEAKPSPTPDPQAADGTMSVRAPDVMPVFAVAVKDKDAVRRVIPKIIDGMGLKGASLLAHTERREDTETVSYANVFSYAFIGDFLIITADAASTKRVVDAYLSHRTLSSDSNFKNFTRWQPREIQGQVYAGPGLIDFYNPLLNSEAINEKMTALLGQLNPVINPLTYALSNDGIGALHELHLPRNLLLLFIAGLTTTPNESPIFANESIAQVLLRTIHSSQTSFHSTKGKGQYGTLDELEKEGFFNKDMFGKHGYKIELNVMANKFEATATPIEYGKTGRLSYFVDETGVLRAGDHGGGAATISDKPID